MEKNKTFSFIKKHYKKIFNQYVLALILIIIVFSLFFNLYTSSLPGNIVLQLEDSRVDSGESTNLRIAVSNMGEEPLVGTLNVSIDHPENINMSIQEDRLTVNLLPGERVERIASIKAVSKAYRTDYEIKVYLISNNTVVDEESIILSVRR